MEAVSEEKARGDAAFRDGNYEDAYNLYTEALEDDDCHVPTLCNRSLAALKLGRLEESLENAEAALQLVQGSAQPAAPQLLAKAVHRKAEALLALGDAVEAVRAYRRGLAACPGSPELHAALRLAVEDLPPAWLAAYWAARVEEAQAPNPLSSRDGRLVRRVPPELALPPKELRAHLQAALGTLQDEARDLMCEAWAEARRPGRAAAALMRGAAYLSAGNAKQALKDARFALAYGPQLDRSLLAAEEEEEARVDLAEKAANRALAPSNGGNGGGGGGAKAAAPRLEDSLPSAALHGRSSAWPAALALHAAALQALPQPDTVMAALSLARAAELEPDNEEHAAGLEVLMRRLPQHQALALKAGGSAALEAQLAGEREAARPEYLRARPKYYYYFEWMRRRIEEQYPALPEAVMDKMLSLEANELDMLLQYPKATQLTVERLLGVFEERGEAALEEYVVPLLSWSDFQAIKEEAAAPALLPPQDPSAAIKRLLPRSVPPPHGDAAAAPAAQPCAGDCRLEGGDAASEAGSLDLDDLCGLD